VCGIAAWELGVERSAMAYFRSEIRRTSYFKAHFGLAGLLSKRGRLDEAIFHYRQALRRVKDRHLKADVLNNLGTAYGSKDQRPRAIELLRHAATLNPRDPMPLVNLALQYLRLGDAQRGRRALMKAYRLKRRGAETRRWVGYALVEYDLDVRRGIRLLERALRGSPDDAGILADLAVGYQKLSETHRAKALARRAERADSKDPEVERQIRRVLRSAPAAGRKRPASRS
jgi:tetratricopeptide (TPR) repeat protein